MRHADLILWLAAAGAVLCFAALGVISLGWLHPQGLPTFDARFTGYSVADARIYLEALTTQGRDLYLGPFRVLDTFLPILLTATLAGLIWRLSDGCHLSLRLMALLLPLDYLAADLAENAKVAQIIGFGDRAPDALIAVASLLTQFKWMTLAGSVLVVLWFWLWQTVKNRRNRA